MFEGARRRKEREIEPIALAVTHLMNAQSTEPVRFWEVLASFIGTEAAARRRRESVTARWHARHNRRADRDDD